MTSLTASRERPSVSPELALVDPGLADWARDRLPAPPDTLEALGVTRPSPPVPRKRRRRWRSRLVTWAAMLGLVAGAAFLVGSRADVETPTAVQPTAVAEQPPADRTGSPRVNPPAARTRAPRRQSGGAIGTRRFAWAPVAGATGYHVELFRGSTLVFRDETTKPEIAIRRRWRFGGRQRRLEPGAYRWYVWPLVNGERGARAIVQAKLVVPR